MAFNFGTNNDLGNSNVPLNFGNMFNTQPVQQTNPIVIPTTSREYAENYSLGPGRTAVFINYNGRRLYIKTQNQNGLSYELEELVLLKPEEFQQMQQSALNNSITDNKSNQSEQYVSLEAHNKDFNSIGGAVIELRDRFEKLEKQFEEFIK